MASVSLRQRKINDSTPNGTQLTLGHAPFVTLNAASGENVVHYYLLDVWYLGYWRAWPRA
jgi:hypothetical protein